jgi:CheY-like chemotaxis protein
MIIEDDPATRDLLSLSLSMEHYSTLQFHTRDDALGLLKKSHPVACAIMDWNMPGLSAEAFMVEARKLLPDFKVILISAHPKAAAIFKQLGVERFLPKPLELETLFKTLKDLHV